MRSRIGIATDLDALVQYARRDGPTPEQRRAVLAAAVAAIGTGAAGGGMGGALTAAAADEIAGGGAAGGAGVGGVFPGSIGSAGFRWLSAKGIAAMSAGVAGTAALGLWLAQPKEPPASSRAVPAVAMDMPEAPREAAQPEEPASASEPSLASSTAPRRPHRETPRPDPAAEAGLIETARRMLSKDPGGALRLVEQHRQQYPAGLLRPERDVVEIEALARLGRTRDAERKASAFRARYPHSIHEPRIRAALGEGAIPPSH